MTVNKATGASKLVLRLEAAIKTRSTGEAAEGEFYRMDTIIDAIVLLANISDAAITPTHQTSENVKPLGEGSISHKSRPMNPHEAERSGQELFRLTIVVNSPGGIPSGELPPSCYL